MRVGIIGIQHESNTFHPDLTELRHFQNTVLLRGAEIFTSYEGAFSEVTGFIEQLRSENIEPVPLLMAFAMPQGPVSDHALDTLWAMIQEELKKAGPLDGFLLAPHGAAVNQSRSDMDGWWLSALRDKIGSSIPMVGVIDPHANLSHTMVETCDALIAYRNNPHTDQKERGIEAAALIARTLRGEVRPTQHASYPAICTNIECHATDERPMSEVARQLDQIRAMPKVLSASFIMGFPYADVPEMGAAVIIISDDDPKLAQCLAQEMESWLWKKREAFLGNLLSPHIALKKALNAPGPVALMDMGDNIGGGASGNSTLLLRLCMELPSSPKTFSCICDPENAAKARREGVGNRFLLSIGNSSPSLTSASLKATAEVISLHNGIYYETQARHGGQIVFDIGPTAVVKVGALTIMLTSKAVLPSSANQMISHGYHPGDFDLIILKGVHSPTAAYREYCPTILRVDTPGITTANLHSLPYHRRRKPLYPFELTPQDRHD